MVGWCALRKVMTTSCSTSAQNQQESHPSVNIVELLANTISEIQVLHRVCWDLEPFVCFTLCVPFGGAFLCWSPFYGPFELINAHFIFSSGDSAVLTDINKTSARNWQICSCPGQLNRWRCQWVSEWRLDFAITTWLQWLQYLQWL